MKTQFGLVTLLIGLILAMIGISSAGGARDLRAPVVPAAAVGSGFTYQGELKNANGPVNATCAFRFALYDTVSGGTQVGPTLNQSIPVVDGLFTAQLDFGAGAFSGASHWLQIAVQCPGDASFILLTPRQQLTAVPYALSLMPGATISGATRVGLTIENTSTSTSFVGPEGFEEVIAAYAISHGVGMEGITTGPVGAGVLGVGRSQNAVGVQGESTDGTGVVGRSPNAVGVQGESTTGTGVVGRSLNAPGMQGESTTAAGVEGRSTDSFGVGGASQTADGVVGSSGGSGSFAGVYGENTGSGWAGWFEGKTFVNGTLSKAAGGFKIDHPLDPANKYLSHSFVESPDMKNIYDGIVTTDGSGTAVVELPSYFGALNRDFRYQLTVIGQFAQAIIASEIADNRFTIKTDQPRVKVSWQVTGIRQDAYATAHPIVVEEEKPSAERGTYLHPLEQGKPAAQGLRYAQRYPLSPDRHAALIGGR